MFKLNHDRRSVFPFFVMVMSIFFASGLPYPGPTHARSFYDGYDLPKALSFCGEPIPLNENHVWELLDQEFTLLVNRRGQILLWLKRSGRYFPYIEKKLIEENMPDDLKYIPVIESSLLTHARSRRGATGLWQFMSATARRYNLQKNRRMDERRNFERSTDIALKYLKDLKALFGTWALAIAAYNCGEKRVNREIKEQKISNYYRMNLPLETERYIFKIIAIKAIMENPGLYGYPIKPYQLFEPLKYDSVQIIVEKPIHITALAQTIGSDFKRIKELNSHIKGYYFPRGKYTIHIPPGKGDQVKQALRRLKGIPSEVSLKSPPNYYVVRPGDTLSHISQETGVPIKRLKNLNNLNNTLIQVGQKIQLTP